MMRVTLRRGDLKHDYMGFQGWGDVCSSPQFWFHQVEQVPAIKLYYRDKAA
jgi:hypothetical protein